jgi:alpha-ketoglutarate-dependent taurine dioxygenase
MPDNLKPLDLSKFKTAGRKPVQIAAENLIRTEFLPGRMNYPFVIRPNAQDLSLSAWAEHHRDYLEKKLLEYGAILFRGFRVDGVDQFERLSHAVTEDLLDYEERAAPRTEVGNRIFTSTHFPADQWIPLHHEMSYSHQWPTKIFFYCAQPSPEGGCTPIAPDREVYKRIDPRIKDCFLKKGLAYVRNYGEGVDMPWQEVFQTQDRSVVEQRLRDSKTEFEWRGADRLRTRAVRQVMATHPVTGEQVWFNHAHMFHMSNLPTEVLAALLEEFREDELPRNAFHADGSSIDASMLDEIRAAYREFMVAFPWEKGDVLMLDNFLSSHGREPFRGPRQILVAMAELYTNTEL